MNSSTKRCIFEKKHLFVDECESIIFKENYGARDWTRDGA